MLKLVLASALGVLLCACTGEPSSSGGTSGLKKIRYRTPEELQKLRAAGAEIIVQQADYVVVRLDSMAVTALASVPAEPIQESDLIQRLVHIKIDSTHTLQQIVDTGLDFWEVKGDTAIARAYDIQLKRLRDAGFEFRVVAPDANQVLGGRE